MHTFFYGTVKTFVGGKTYKNPWVMNESRATEEAVIVKKSSSALPHVYPTTSDFRLYQTYYHLSHLAVG